MMKKIYTMLMMVMMAVAFTSCEDGAIAYDLEGTWRGQMHISSRYNGVVYNSVRSEITFDRNPYEYASGRGYWVDYYDDYGWGTDYVANTISWEVVNRVIKIWFEGERSYFEIRNYSLNDRYFEGYIWDGGQDVYFSLTKIARPASYNSYRWNDWDYDYFWARTRSEYGDSTEVRDMPVRFVNPELKVVE